MYLLRVFCCFTGIIQGAGRALETGAKIYVCRVDKTKHSVMDLAATLNMQSRKRKQQKGENGDDQNDEGPMDVDGGEDPNEDRPKHKKKPRKVHSAPLQDVKFQCFS
jgi:hypothetical protein